MSSSKATDNGPHPTPPPAVEVVGAARPLRQLALVVLTVLLLAAGIAGWLVWHTQEDLTPLLDEARLRLQKIETADPTARVQHAQFAEDLLLQYVEQNTDDQGAYLLLLAAAAVTGEREELDEWLTALNLSQVGTADLQTAAQLLFSIGQFGLADRVIAAALERPEHREESLRLAALVRYDLGRGSEVIEHCQELAQLAPTDPTPWRVMAYVYEDRSDLDHLNEVLREIIKRTPPGENAPYRLQLIDILIATGAAADARAAFDTLQAESPEVVRNSPLTEIKLLELEGQADEALRKVRAFLAENPQHVDALMIDAQISMARAEWHAALTALTAVLKEAPAEHEAHYRLGQVYARLGNTEAAQKHLDRHKQILDTKVQLYQLERQAEREPMDDAIRERIAKLYDEIGWDDQARFWRRAAESARTLRAVAEKSEPHP